MILRSPYPSLLTAAWTPASLGARLIADYDPAALTGYSDGDLVSTFSDSSPNGRNATAAGSLRAIYRASSIGGKPALEFSGGQGYATGLVNLTATTSLSVFAVFDASSGGDQVLLEQGANYNVTNGFILYRDTGNFVVISHSSTAEVTAARFGSVLTYPTPRYLYGTLNRASVYPQCDLWLNNDNSGGYGAFNTISPGNYRDAPLYIGARNQSSLFMTGKISRLIIATGVDAADRTSWASYAASTWGL